MPLDDSELLAGSQEGQWSACRRLSEYDGGGSVGTEEGCCESLGWDSAMLLFDLLVTNYRA